MSGQRRALVIGLARSGMALARTLAEEGWSVLVVDSGESPSLRERAAELPQGVTVQLGGYDTTALRGAAMVCPSPGVRWDAPELVDARNAGIPIRSEIALVFERCRGRIIGIMDSVVAAADPYRTDVGRLRMDEILPKRVR